MNRSLPLCIALLFSACATTTDETDVDDTADDSKADSASRPAGVYSRREATDDQLFELVLLSDRTFQRYEASGDWRERGTYQFTKSTTTAKRYIRFLDEDGALIDRYTYTMSGSVVKLSRDGAAYPMFSVATGDAAWVEAIKSDWFDEAFQDWGAELFPRMGIRRADLPAAAQAIYDQAVNATIYRFDLHGRTGFEMVGGSPSVRLFDSAGKQIASGDGDSLFDFEWN